MLTLYHLDTSSSHSSAKNTHAVASLAPQRTFNHGSGAATVLSNIVLLQSWESSLTRLLLLLVRERAITRDPVVGGNLTPSPCSMAAEAGGTLDTRNTIKLGKLASKARGADLAGMGAHLDVAAEKTAFVKHDGSDAKFTLCSSQSVKVKTCLWFPWFLDLDSKHATDHPEYGLAFQMQLVSAESPTTPDTHGRDRSRARTSSQGRKDCEVGVFLSLSRNTEVRQHSGSALRTGVHIRDTFVNFFSLAFSIALSQSSLAHMFSCACPHSARGTRIQRLRNHRTAKVPSHIHSHPCSRSLVSVGSLGVRGLFTRRA